jgi:hypothetical protein
MKLTAKNLPVFLRILVLCLIVGTLAWELVERILLLMGIGVDLTVGPVGFDIEVIVFSIMANPGTLLGIVPAIALFRRM